MYNNALKIVVIIACARKTAKAGPFCVPALQVNSKPHLPVQSFLAPEGLAPGDLLPAPYEVQVYVGIA